MTKTKTSQLPYGVKEKTDDNTSVLKELQELDWLDQLPKQPGTAVAISYGTRDPIFK